MYYINKIIGCVVSPVGLAIIGGAGALIYARLKRQRVAKWLGWLTVAWLWLWMTPIMTWIVGVPLERVLLVTSAWHMKRARLMFEKYAPEIEVVCAPADFENTFTVEMTPFFKALLPDPTIFYLNSVAFHEWVGIVGYRVFR